MTDQIDTVRESTQKLLDGQLGATPAILHACPACGSSRCAKRTSKAGAAYYRCMDCDAAFGDDGGKPGKRFEDNPRSEDAANKAAASGPKCPTCKKPTFKNETKTGKSYYRCGGCKGGWWPDRKDEGRLGSKWEDRK